MPATTNIRGASMPRACGGLRGHRAWGLRFKRLLDVALSIGLLAVFALPMVLVALAIRLTMGPPVLFRQRRPGKDRKEFTLLKFRTMTDARDANGRPLPDSQRLTPLGRLLRKTSLDELPQLINVLRGEMSLVGPRPLLSRYLPYYTARESLRFSVPPGITGWAQIHGRNALGWDDRLALDAWYVENWSLGLDLRILAKTVLCLFRRRGVVVDTSSQELPDLDHQRRAFREQSRHVPNPAG